MIADMPARILTVLQNPQADLATPSGPFNIEPVGFAMSARDSRFVNLIQMYINAFEDTGVLADLRDNWLKEGDWALALP